MKMYYLLALAVMLQLPLFGQKKEDMAAIKDMCGCYKITFQFAETFSPDTNYEFHDRYTAHALEWVELVSEDKNKLVLQHLLLAGEHIIKHWRQDWIYQNTDFYRYDGDNKWVFEQKDKAAVKKQWTQKVYQVDDSPRYEASGSWVHVDGKHYWESVADSPLPRRDASKRSDYNIMVRGNRQEITDRGWVHAQENTKVQRENGKDKIIAFEKGYNVYEKVDDSKCQKARDWWTEKHSFWANVRTEWDALFAKGQNIQLKKKVDDQPLFMHMFGLNTDQTAEIKPTIEKFVMK